MAIPTMKRYMVYCLVAHGFGKNICLKLLSKIANLLCSILCFLFVRRGMPAFIKSAIMDFLPLDWVRSVIMRTGMPRLWALMIALLICGLVME